MSNLVERLRESAKGYEEWRVVSPADGRYCFSSSYRDSIDPEGYVREWFDAINKRLPNNMYKDFIVKKVIVQTSVDNLMLEAADEIERLRKGEL